MQNKREKGRIHENKRKQPGGGEGRQKRQSEASGPVPGVVSLTYLP